LLTYLGQELNSSNPFQALIAHVCFIKLSPEYLSLAKMPDMRKKIVAGNWKMNTTMQEALELTGALVNGIDGTELAQVIVCPPFPWLTAVAAALGNTSIEVGAQNCSAESKGAFTGEVSAGMLTSAGCTAVIIGHSERRSLYGETNQVVAQKLHTALSHGLTTILCVGETLQERESGQLEKIISEQLATALTQCSIDDYQSIVIAYEPVWAIGTGLTATPEQAQEVHHFIRTQLTSLSNAEVASSTSILYGGSCNATNAASIFAQADIDGGLIGGAALKATDFLTIARSF
jgi:triosephosphate isomerase (TIM)